MSGVAADGRDRVLSPLRILLAEDNLMIQDMMLRMLRSRGHDVTVANNGREAVAAVQGSHFDVVLMDVRMPEMDGHEAAAMIRAGEVGSATRVPIIAMTADVLADDRARCLASGMDDYLSKPSPPKVIVDTIARCLENLSRAGAKPGTTGGA